MILAASFPAIGAKVNFTSTTSYIIMAVIVVAAIVEGKFVNKVNLLFPFMVFCMFLTASTELGTNHMDQRPSCRALIR